MSKFWIALTAATLAMSGAAVAESAVGVTATQDADSPLVGELTGPTVAIGSAAAAAVVVLSAGGGGGGSSTSSSSSSTSSSSSSSSN